MGIKSFVFRFDDVEVREREFSVIKAGKVLNVEPKAFRALAFLLRNPQRLISKEEILNAVWGDAAVTEGSLTRCIWHLRSVLGDDIRSPRYIETVATLGYRFLCDVRAVEDGPTLLSGDGIAEARMESPTAVGFHRESLARPGEDTRPRLPVRLHSPWIAVAIGAVGLAVLNYWLLRPPARPIATGYAQITNDERSKVAPVNLFATTVTDGSRLYFGEFSGGHWSLAQASALGGETVIISAPFDLPQLADISPNRSELLVANFTGSETDAPLWVLSIPAGTPRRLGNLIGHDGTWSPDGKRLAYANGNHLNVARANGSGSHTLVTAPSPPLWIRWSPDGKVLRFTLADRSLAALLLPHASASSLWEISADGKDFHRLLQGWNNPPAECCGNWTPNGKYYVFQSNRNAKTDIWAIREKGFLLRPADREPVRVTAGQIDSRTPVPSADGTKLFVTGALAQGELSTFDPKSQQLVPFLSGISVKDVSFSADRKWIAYIAYPQGTLWRSKLDGQDRLQLTVAPMQAFFRAGRQMADKLHSTLSCQANRGRFIQSPLKGATPVEIAPAGHSEADPDWSPDGNSLVFGSLPWLETSTPQAVHIYILDFTTHRISSLPGSQGLFSPHWSPDGRYIAALSSDSQRIMLFDFKTQKWSELVHIVAPILPGHTMDNTSTFTIPGASLR